jgi:hypothetical protein
MSHRREAAARPPDLASQLQQAADGPQQQVEALRERFDVRRRQPATEFDFNRRGSHRVRPLFTYEGMF